MNPFLGAAELQKWLQTVHIDTSLWGTGYAKTIDDLWAELTSGDSFIKDNPPLRLVNVVQILIRKDKQQLMEAEQELGNGQRRFRSQPPSEKMKSGESYLETAVRCLQEELGVVSQDVTFLTETYEQVQKESDSPSYPGLPTRYTFHIIEAQVEGLPDRDFWRDNHAHGEGDPVRRHFWTWQRLQPNISGI